MKEVGMVKVDQNTEVPLSTVVGKYVYYIIVVYYIFKKIATKYGVKTTWNCVFIGQCQVAQFNRLCYILNCSSKIMWLVRNGNCLCCNFMLFSPFVSFCFRLSGPCFHLLIIVHCSCFPFSRVLRSLFEWHLLYYIFRKFTAVICG